MQFSKATTVLTCSSSLSFLLNTSRFIFVIVTQSGSSKQPYLLWKLVFFWSQIQLLSVKQLTMKKITVLLLLLTVGTFAGAQALDTVTIVSKAKKFKPSEYFLVMFELMDTVDVSGKKITMSRGYYFDKQNRMLSSVRESDNCQKPEKGAQVIYSFGKNKLTSVTVIPPKSTCKNCASRYYYSNDSLLSKQENKYTNANSAVFIQQAHYFQSKLPNDLPWGYFDDEVLVNGVRKKIKRQY